MKYQNFSIFDNHIGQFWNIDVTAHPSDTSLGEGTVPYVVNVKHPQAQLRSFLADHYNLVWDESFKPCLYAGSSQGGSISDVEPNDPVIEGSYHEYEVNSLFGYQFKYNRLNSNDLCLMSN